MFFTGENPRLQMPNVDQFTFGVENIIVNNNASYSVRFATLTEQIFLSFANGTIQGNVLAPHIGTYNTGEPFSISGAFFYTPGAATNSFIVYVNGIGYRTDGYQRQPLNIIDVLMPTSGAISLDIHVEAEGVNYTIDFPSTFEIGSRVTGTIIADHRTFLFGNDFTFYNSFETLLTGNQIFAYLETNTPENFVFGDNDTSFQNNELDFLLSVQTASGDINENFSISRSGLYNDTLTQLTNQNTNNLISTLFGGIWTGGNQFVYRDTPQSLTMNYVVSTTDSLGQSIGDTISYAFDDVSPISGQTFVSEYVTGFQLTNSGQYTALPSVIFTGYYYVTGLQQSLNSMLFSSGCTGGIPVGFGKTTLFGTGASGILNLGSVTFQNIYGTGNNSFYVVNSFSLLSGGTGYGVPPRAILNTGIYSNCYDVVARSGINISFFLPFNTSGGLNPSAAYLTGEVLTTTGIVGTGLVSGGYTGYMVTGFNLTNPGSGYNTNYKPFMRFVRDSLDLIPSASGFGASGTLSTKATGFYNFSNIWLLETGFAGYTLSSGNYAGTIIKPANLNYLSFRVTSSGIDNTTPVVTSLTLTTANGTTVTQFITGIKTYNTDTGYLKKKLNVTGIFIQGSELNFLTSQSDLDNFYSTAGYTNNIWEISLGDLDF